jgi:hypothetical protein
LVDIGRFLSRYYANITAHGPHQAEVLAWLNEQKHTAYVAPTVKGRTVIYHQDLDGQERLTATLSANFQCPALLVMTFNETILLYQLYVNGGLADTYVSSPHDELDLGDAVVDGNATILCEAFGMEHAAARVERVLRRPTHPTKGYALAVNRHGELARALGLPLFAAGAGFGDVELGELPAGQGFDPAQLMKTS